jgi:hypothetical protein
VLWFMIGSFPFAASYHATRGRVRKGEQSC